MACDLDVNSDLTNFFVQNIDDEIEIVLEKKVNQRENEWGKCLKNWQYLLSGKSRIIELKVEKVAVSS